MPIETVRDLQSHLQLAIKVELSTIPPYLFAMYSIENQAAESALLLRSIVAEEMLHVALATNLLLAVGGQPDFSSTAYMPRYPADLPHHTPPLHLGLAPCTGDLIREVFMRIEQPETHGAPAQPDMFETLGQFYHALEIGLEALSGTGSLFDDPQMDRQMADPSFYQPIQFDADDSGGLLGIHNLGTAIEAIEVIVHQGEGLSDDRWADPAHQELTHYHKLARILETPEEIGVVLPLRSNPRSRDYPAEVRVVSDLFNATYRHVYLVMADLFSPAPDKGRHVGRLYGLMTGVLSILAHHLVRLPLSDGEVAAPTFEPYEFQSDDPRSETLELAREAQKSYDSLGEAVEVLAKAIA